MMKFDRPWQNLPANLIAHAIEHAELQTEFDHQIAFLLLDVGVETLLNVYKALPENVRPAKKIENTLNRNRNAQGPAPEAFSEKANFHQLISVIKELSGDKLAQIDLDDVEYLHGIRNKLYHQGDGVTATTYNLSKYVEICKKLLEILIGVDLNKRWSVMGYGSESYFVRDGDFDSILAFEFLSMKKSVSDAFDELALDLGAAAEYISPRYTGRKFERQSRRILHEHVDDDDGDNYVERAEQQKIRAQLFNELTANNISDFDLIDNILKYPSFAWCIVVFRKLYKDPDHETGMFWTVVDFIEERSERAYTIYEEGNGKLPLFEIRNPDEIYKQYQAIMAWIKDVRTRLEAFINEQEQQLQTSRQDTLNSDQSAQT